MKTLIIFAHPSTNSFNHAILDNFLLGQEAAGVETRVNDLYKENFDPILLHSELKMLNDQEIPERIKKQQELVTWADNLVFIYPLWWYDRPAILKGWFDVVFTNGFAFSYGKDGIKGLLKDKKTLVLITAGGAKSYFEENNALDLIHAPVTNGTLGFCGISDVQHKIFYDVSNCDDKQRNNMLLETRQLGENF